jgi:hypothetical protein
LNFPKVTKNKDRVIQILLTELEEAEAARFMDQKHLLKEIASWKMRYSQLEEEHAQSCGGVNCLLLLECIDLIEVSQ